MDLPTPEGPRPRIGGLVLAACAGLGALMGAPVKPPSPGEVEEQRLRFQARWVQEELEEALSAYRDEHGSWPAGDELEGALAPYLQRRSVNPRNGMSTVRRAGAEGPSGWVFDPRTGRVRSGARPDRGSDA